MKEGSHSGYRALEMLVAALWYAVEMALFVPIDLLTVAIRDTVIPRAVKTRLPFLSCRRYLCFGRQVDCGPAMKYRHEGLFKTVICEHYDVGTGGCRRAKYRQR
ncbi:MAG: hypothetical protein ACYSU0_20275 [Planctomycetota bacterium]